MPPVDFGGGLATDARTKAGRSLEELERRLVERLQDVARCLDHTREPGLCVHPAGPGRYQVSVTDCCCDRHARLIRQSAEEELGREVRVPDPD